MEFLTMLDINTVAMLLTGGLTVATSVFGVKYKKYLKVVSQLIDMVEDGEITKEELQKFVKTIKRVF